VARNEDDTDVLERIILEPDPGLIKSLGAHHSLHTAIADLVDNSIDAIADRVIVSFEVDRGVAVGLTVVDNGHGMNGRQADDAMRLGRRRKYKAGSQGHFGIGLKAAAFSHADTLTVYTTPGGGSYHGRRLRKADVERDYSCEILEPTTAKREAARWLRSLRARSGTVVRLSDTTFPRFTGAKLDEWLNGVIADLRMHLGLIYHRLLADGRIRIQLESYDHDLGQAGVPEEVTPIDPFGFPVSAVAGYPKTLIATINETSIEMNCHIVPPKSSGPQYRLYGGDGAAFQGFYIYRNDRLLQTGGWNHVTTKMPSRALARVAIEDFASLRDHVRMTPEKTGISFTADLQNALTLARSVRGGAKAMSFEDYLSRAETVLISSKRRIHGRKPVVAPGRGLHEHVRRVIRAEIPLRKNEDPIDIRWRTLPPDMFMELDREARVVHLNQRYREMLTGGYTGLSDAPLLKSLVFLLTEDHFTGQHWGPRDKDLVDLWNSVLGAAIQTEDSYRSERSQ